MASTTFGSRSSSSTEGFLCLNRTPRNSGLTSTPTKKRWVKNFEHHARWQFHRLLEQLVIDRYAPNHLDRIADGQSELSDALRKAGLAGLTRDELLEKRDEYIECLEAGDAPYSSKLYGSYWIESPNKEQLIVSFKN